MHCYKPESDIKPGTILKSDINQELLLENVRLRQKLRAMRKLLQLTRNVKLVDTVVVNDVVRIAKKPRRFIPQLEPIFEASESPCEKKKLTSFSSTVCNSDIETHAKSQRDADEKNQLAQDTDYISKTEHVVYEDERSTAPSTPATHGSQSAVSTSSASSFQNSPVTINSILEYNESTLSLKSSISNAISPGVSQIQNPYEPDFGAPHFAANVKSTKGATKKLRHNITPFRKSSQFSQHQASAQVTDEALENYPVASTDNSHEGNALVDKNTLVKKHTPIKKKPPAKENTPIKENSLAHRLRPRSKRVNYKEPSMRIKLRRATEKQQFDPFKCCPASQLSCTNIGEQSL